MKQRIAKMLRLFGPAALALALTVGSAQAQTTAVVNLKVGETTIVMPDLQEIPMWGYGLAGVATPIEIPGPTIVVPPDATSLQVNLTNELPTGTATSIIIPGLGMPVVQVGASPEVVRNPDGRIRSFTHETTPGTTVAYKWANVKPGTYLYHSGTHPQVQVQMGLYGAVNIDASATDAYTGVAYDTDVQLLYSEIDPALHEVVAAGTYGTSMTSTIDYNPQYFLVNGQPYSESAAALGPVSADQTVLVRLLNAGLESHAPMFQGLYVNLIAEDGNLYPYAREQYAVLLPAGKTLDALVTPAAGTYPIYDRMLDLTNGTAPAGGLLSYLEVLP